MGSAASSATSNKRGFGGIENKLGHVRLRSSDPIIAMGLMHEVTAACSRNSADIATFFRVMVTDPIEGGPTSNNTFPFRELFDKGQQLPDEKLKGLAVSWIRLVLDHDSAVAVPHLVDCGFVGFMKSLYAAQQHQHMSRDTMNATAEAVDDMCYFGPSVKAMVAADAYRTLVHRLKYTMPGTERQHILSAIHRSLERDGAVADTISKPDMFEILIKCLTDKAETNTISLVGCCRAIADIMSRRKDCTVGPKQLMVVMGLFERSPEFYPQTARIMCIAMNNDTSKDFKNSHTVAKHFRSLYSTRFVEERAVGIEWTLQLTNLTIETEAEARSFAQSHQLTTISARIRENTDNDAAVAQYLELLERLADFESLLVAVANSGALDFLLQVFEQSPSESLGAVLLLKRLCMVEEVASVLLQQKRFHTLLRKISPHGGDEEMMTALEAVNLLKSLLTPAVTETADIFLIECIQSLLCQVVSQCPNPVSRSLLAVTGQASMSEPDSPTFSATAGRRNRSRTLFLSEERQAAREQEEEPKDDTPAPEKILEIVLELLEGRAAASVDAATAIMNLLPLDRIRSLMSQSNNENIAKLASKLRNTIASSSPKAKEELEFYGCVTDRARLSIGAMAFQTKGKITITVLQRHWRTVLRARHASRFRAGVSRLHKIFYLAHTELLEEEKEAWRGVEAKVGSQLSQINRFHNQRVELMDVAIADRSSVETPEEAQRGFLMQMVLDSLETIERGVQVQEEEAVFGFYEKLLEVSAEEIAVRMRDRTTTIAEHNALMSRHAVRIRQIDKLYESRRSHAIEETRIRQEYADEEHTRRVRYWRRYGLLHMQDEECHARTAIFVEGMQIQSDMIQDMYPLLRKETDRIEGVERDALLADMDESFLTTMHCGERLWIEIEENGLRREAVRWETRIREVLMSRFYGMIAGDVVVLEKRERSHIGRECVMEWRHKLHVTFPKLRINVEEEAGRNAISHERSVGFGMIWEALKYMAPRAIELEESRYRMAILLEYREHAAQAIRDVKVLRLVADEAQARNSISMQAFFTMRQLITPLNVLRLRQFGMLLLMDDLYLRARMIADQDFAFRLLCEQEVIRRHRLERSAILREYQSGFDSLHRHCISVTHIMRIQREARASLRTRTIM